MIGYNEKQERENLQALFISMEAIRLQAAANYDGAADETIVKTYATLALRVLHLHSSGRYPLNFYHRKNTLRSIHTLLATQPWTTATDLEPQLPGLCEGDVVTVKQRIAMEEQIEASWLVIEKLMALAEKICDTQDIPTLAKWIRGQKWATPEKKDGKENKKPKALTYDVLDNDYSAIERIAEQWHYTPTERDIIRLPKAWVDHYAPETALLAAMMYRQGSAGQCENTIAAPSIPNYTEQPLPDYRAIPHGQNSLGRYDPNSKTADRFFVNACKGQEKQKNKLMSIRKFHGITVVALKDDAAQAIRDIDLPDGCSAPAIPAPSLPDAPDELPMLLSAVRELYQNPVQAAVQASTVHTGNIACYEVADQGGCEPWLAFQERRKVVYSLALQQLLEGKMPGADAVLQLKALFSSFLAQNQPVIKKSNITAFALQNAGPDSWQFELIKRTLAFLCPVGGQLVLFAPGHPEDKDGQLTEEFLQIWDQKISADGGAALCAFIRDAQHTAPHEILLRINQKKHEIRCDHLPVVDSFQDGTEAVAGWLCAGVHDVPTPTIDDAFADAFTSLATTGFHRFCQLWEHARHPRAMNYIPAPQAQTHGRFALSRAEDMAFLMVCRYILCKAAGGKTPATQRFSPSLAGASLQDWCRALMNALCTNTVQACCNQYASYLQVGTSKTTAGAVLDVFKIKRDKKAT